MDLTRVINVISVAYIANIMQCDRKLITSCGCKIALQLFSYRHRIFCTDILQINTSLYERKGEVNVNHIKPFLPSSKVDFKCKQMTYHAMLKYM